MGERERERYIIFYYSPCVRRGALGELAPFLGSLRREPGARDEASGELALGVSGSR